MIYAIIYLVVLIVVLVAVFLLAREYICWYWKINEAISLLDGIHKSLEKIASSSKGTVPSKTTPGSGSESQAKGDDGRLTDLIAKLKQEPPSK